VIFGITVALAGVRMSTQTTGTNQTQELLPSPSDLPESISQLKSQIDSPRFVADSGEDRVILDLGHIYVQALYCLTVS
jgi:hypothetical protein